MEEQQQHSLYLHLQPRPAQPAPPTPSGGGDSLADPESLLISNELDGQYVEVVVVVLRIDQNRCDAC